MPMDAVLGIVGVIVEAVGREVDAAYTQWRRRGRQSALEGVSGALSGLLKPDGSWATCHLELESVAARLSVRTATDRDGTELLAIVRTPFPRTTVYWPPPFRDSPLSDDPQPDRDTHHASPGGALICTAGKEAAARSLCKGVDLITDRVRRPLTIRVTSQGVLVRIAATLTAQGDLEAVVRGSAELLRVIGQLGEPAPSEPVATSTVPAGRCLVCAETLGCTPLVRCPRCQSMYHARCWEYVQGCSLYGCSPDPSLRRSALA